MFSDFGKKLTGESGILQLMEDLGAPLPKGKKICALGGGNPAQIPELEKMYRAEMELIMKDGRAFEDLIGKYDGPQGKNAFINSVASFFSRNFGWNVKPENIAVCNGSQSACFYLFNLLSFGFNPSQLLLLVVVFLDFVGMLPSPVACVLQHSLSVLAVVFMVVQRSLFPSLFLLPSAILLYLFWVCPSVL